jgi:hypothetical protein
LKPALYKRSSESEVGFGRSFLPPSNENLQATIFQAITFFLLVFFGISRKYCQLYLTQFTLLVRRQGLEIRQVLEACCRGSPLTRFEVCQYHSPPAVLIGELSMQK